ncbi:MAG: hypothetical protein M3P91_08860 [Actinomycetota bacterium]|nr:hypothetical protein [Actinomycetota bacterium]
MTAFAAASVDPDRVTPGALGFFVFVALGVGLYLLIRSMNKHLRRVPLSFEDAAGGPSATGGQAPTSGQPHTIGQQRRGRRADDAGNGPSER